MKALAALTPRTVYCATEHLRRDVALARDVCAGRFTIAGATIVVDSIPRWTGTDIHPDREWWIEWSKFYYGLDLAYAFSVGGDEIFLHTWERLVRSWIQQVPVGFGPTDALGRRLQNWTYAWSAFARTAAFSGFAAGFETLLRNRVFEEAEYLQAHLTPERNHRTLELYALFLVALAWPEIDPDGERRRFAWDQLHQNLLSDFRADGVHCEHSTHYHMVALRSFVAARENARRFDVAVPASYDQRLARAVEFAMYSQRPDGSIAALSDSDVGDYRESLALAADLLHRPDVLFVATSGRSGEPPSATHADFPEAGYYIRRSSWRQLPDEAWAHRHLTFDCGSLGDGGHGHYDLLNIEAWAGGPLIVDPGRFTYAEGTPNWRHWFKGTAAHNTVCVDGLDQTAYRQGKPKGDTAVARRLTSVSAPFLDVVGGEARSSQYNAIHRRHVFFAADDYWIVLDQMDASTPHEYDLRFHLAPHASQQISVRGRRVTAPGVTLLFDGPGPLVIEDGWVSCEYGVKNPAPVVSMRVNRRDNARFITAIVPAGRSRSQEQPDFSVEDAMTGGLEMTLTGTGVDGGCVDRVMWREGGTAVTVRDVDAMADAAWIRTSRNGVVVAFAACGLRHVAIRGDAVAPADWICSGPDGRVQIGSRRQP